MMFIGHNNMLWFVFYFTNLLDHCVVNLELRLHAMILAGKERCAIATCASKYLCAKFVECAGDGSAMKEAARQVTARFHHAFL